MPRPTVRRHGALADGATKVHGSTCGRLKLLKTVKLSRSRFERFSFSTTLLFFFKTSFPFQYSWNTFIAVVWIWAFALFPRSLMRRFRRRAEIVTLLEIVTLASNRLVLARGASPGAQPAPAGRRDRVREPQTLRTPKSTHNSSLANLAEIMTECGHTHTLGLHTSSDASSVHPRSPVGGPSFATARPDVHPCALWDDSPSPEIVRLCG